MATTSSAYRPAAPASLERRGAARRAVLVMGALEPSGGAPEAGELGDLSAYGCRIASAGARRAGERLWVTLAGAAPVAATVVWAEGGDAGCRFDESLPRALLRALTLGIG